MSLKRLFTNHTFLLSVKLLVLSLVLGGIVSLLVPSQTASALNANDYPGWVRPNIRSYDDGCPSNPNKYWLWSWISPEGQPTTNQVTVPYGTTSVNLWYQSTVFTCRDLINVDGRTYAAPLPNDGTHRPASALRENRNYIAGISVTPDGSFSPSPAGNTGVAGYDPNTRYWFGGPIFFVYRPAAPLTATRTIIVRMDFKGVNRFSSGAYRCTANGAATTFARFSIDCPTTTIDFPIQINVSPPPPVTIQGRVFNASTGGGYGGVTIETCTGQYPVTDGAGFFSLSLPVGTAHCVRIAGGGPGGIVGPYVRPWAEGYGGCPGYGPGAASPNYCTLATTYECQWAGRQAPSCGSDRSSDTGFDIVYDFNPFAQSCGGVVTSPITPEPNETYSTTASFNFSGGPPGNRNYSVNFNVPGVLVGNFGSGTVFANGSNGTTTVPVTRGGMSSPEGRYTGTYSVSGDFSIGPCAVTIVIASKPYFQLAGGDIATGISSCTSTAWLPLGGGILTAWNNGAGGAGNKGAGTNIAAFARSVIDGFTSAQTPSGSSPPKDLSFSNTAGNPTYGGNFDGGIPCPTDYYSTGNAIASSGGGPVNVAGLASSAKYGSGGSQVTINGGSIGPGTRIAVYVDGDAYVTSNIQLTGGPWTLDQIPSFYLIAKGDIYIDPAVTQLDGVYVAHPDSGGGKGRIYTCSRNNLFLPPTTAQLNGNDASYQSCKNVLTVNGAFIARELKLYRSFGSLSNTPPAEIFYYSPAIWLAAPQSIIDGGLGSGYDAITSLPPIL